MSKRTNEKTPNVYLRPVGVSGKRCSICQEPGCKFFAITEFSLTNIPQIKNYSEWICLCSKHSSEFSRSKVYEPRESIYLNNRG
jgi:hypothetical protein